MEAREFRVQTLELVYCGLGVLLGIIGLLASTLALFAAIYGVFTEQVFSLSLVLSIPVIAVFVLMIISFLLSSLYTISRWYHGKPKIIVTNEGFFDYTGFWNIGFIPWEDVELLSPECPHLFFSLRIVIQLRREQQFLSAKSLLHRIILRFEKWRYGGYIFLDENREVYSALKQAFEKFRK